MRAPCCQRSPPLPGSLSLAGVSCRKIRRAVEPPNGFEWRLSDAPVRRASSRACPSIEVGLCASPGKSSRPPIVVPSRQLAPLQGLRVNARRVTIKVRPQRLAFWGALGGRDPAKTTGQSLRAGMGPSGTAPHHFSLPTAFKYGFASPSCTHIELCVGCRMLNCGLLWRRRGQVTDSSDFDGRTQSYRFMDSETAHDPRSKMGRKRNGSFRL